MTPAHEWINYYWKRCQSVSHNGLVELREGRLMIAITSFHSYTAWPVWRALPVSIGSWSVSFATCLEVPTLCLLIRSILYLFEDAPFHPQNSSFSEAYRTMNALGMILVPSTVFERYVALKASKDNSPTTSMPNWLCAASAPMKNLSLIHLIGMTSCWDLVPHCSSQNLMHYASKIQKVVI